MSIIQDTTRAVLPSNILEGKCFLCGNQPSSGRGEHVIPLWLQNRYGLLDKKLTLLNGSLIPYRQLTVPCCPDCNNVFLSDLEQRVIDVIDKGEVSDKLEAIACARWMAKILIGILTKETGLLFDRSSPTSEKIVPAEMIEELRHGHLLLQSGRKRLQFHGLHSTYPFSFYWYRIGRSDGEEDFDLSTNVVGQSVAIRIGTLGMAFVNDGGMQMEVGASGPYELNGATVTGIQFSELSARIHYKSGLRDATHAYLFSETDDEFVLTQHDVRPFSNVTFPDGSVRIFEEWNAEDFAQVAFRITGLPANAFYNAETGREGTTLGSLLSPDQVEEGSGVVHQYSGRSATTGRALERRPST